MNRSQGPALCRPGDRSGRHEVGPYTQGRPLHTVGRYKRLPRLHLSNGGVMSVVTITMITTAE
jgi:hypothetical protein